MYLEPQAQAYIHIGVVETKLRALYLYWPFLRQEWVFSPLPPNVLTLLPSLPAPFFEPWICKGKVGPHGISFRAGLRTDDEKYGHNRYKSHVVFDWYAGGWSNLHAQIGNNFNNVTPWQPIDVVRSLYSNRHVHECSFNCTLICPQTPSTPNLAALRRTYSELILWSSRKSCTPNISANDR